MKKNIFWVAGMLCLLGCTDKHEGVYDPDFAIKQYESDWKTQIGDIDPGQTWNMAVSRSAKVTLKEDALSDYQIQLFTANPLYNPEAMLLANYKLTTDASGVGSVSFKFDLPQRAQSVYAVRMDSHNRRLVKRVDISGEEAVNVSFGMAESKAARAAELGALPTMNAPYTVGQVNELIASGYDLKGGFKYRDEWGGPATMENLTKIGGFGTYTAVVSGRITVKNSFLNCSVNSYIDKDTRATLWNVAPQVAMLKVVITSEGILEFESGEVAKLYLADIIVADGGILDLTAASLQMLEGARVIVMPGGRVIDNANNRNLSIDNNAETALIYNAGTIDVKLLNFNYAILYNADGGILKSDEIYFANSAEKSVLTNWGNVEVDYVRGNGNQGTVNNGCHLNVKKEFSVNFLNQNANASIECEKISFQGGVTLRENSIIRSSHLSMNLTDVRYVGSAGGNAIVSTQTVDYVNPGENGIRISANIYFEADTYADGKHETEEDQYGGYHHAIENALLASGSEGPTKVGNAPIVIPSGDCTGSGNTPIENVPLPDPTAMTWTLAYEDLGGIGDFDFNDVVLRVSHASGATTANVTLCAAGGTLDTHVYYGTLDLGEVHEKFGVSASVMVNTGSGADRNMVELGPVTVDGSFSLSSGGDMFKIRVTKEDNTTTNEISLPSQEGVVPQVICIEGKWAWPTERTPIDMAYEDFGKWGSNYGSNTNWHTTSSGAVIRK